MINQNKSTGMPREAVDKLRNRRREEPNAERRRSDLNVTY